MRAGGRTRSVRVHTVHVYGVHTTARRRVTTYACACNARMRSMPVHSTEGRKAPRVQRVRAHARGGVAYPAQQHAV